MIGLLLGFTQVATAEEQDAVSSEQAVVRKMKRINKLIGRQTDSSIALLDATIDSCAQADFAFGVARAKSLKSWALAFHGRYEDATTLGHEALAIQEELQDSIGIGKTLNRIGISLLSFERYADADDYLTRSLAYFKALNDTALIDVLLNNLGVSASEQDLNQKAINYYKESLRIRMKLGNQHWVAFSCLNIGSTYTDIQQWDSADHYLKRSLETFRTKTKQKYVPAMALLIAAEFHFETRDFKEAISVVQQGLEKAVEEDHTEIIKQGRELLSKALFANGQYREAYEAEALYQELKDSLIAMNSEAEVAEVEARYQTAEKEIEIAQLKNDKLEADNRLRKFGLIVAIAALALLVTGAVIFFLNLRKRQRQAIKETELNTKIAEARLLGLRAQMNPHFMFNCINTAQGFVLDSNKVAAYEYLSKFARLLRLVLEHSGMTYIPLEHEVELIELYLELESTRFSQQFTYAITLSDDLTKGSYEIPSMLIQPLVENAILHGLVNRKETGGELQVRFALKGELIACEVEDNGIGRKRAQEIKAEKQVHYISKAIPNVNERLEIIRQELKTDVKLEMIDHMDGEMPTGTTARLLLPSR